MLSTTRLLENLEVEALSFEGLEVRTNRSVNSFTSSAHQRVSLMHTSCKSTIFSSNAMRLLMPGFMMSSFVHATIVVGQGTQWISFWSRRLSAMVESIGDYEKLDDNVVLIH